MLAKAIMKLTWDVEHFLGHLLNVFVIIIL